MWRGPVHASVGALIGRAPRGAIITRGLRPPRVDCVPGRDLRHGVALRIDRDPGGYVAPGHPLARPLSWFAKFAPGDRLQPACFGNLRRRNAALRVARRPVVRAPVIAP